MKKALIFINLALLIILAVLVVLSRSPKSRDNGISSPDGLGLPQDQVQSSTPEDAQNDFTEEEDTSTPPTPPSSSARTPTPTTPSATNKPVSLPPASPTPSAPVQEQSRTDQYGNLIVTYYYTGFSPKLVDIKPGEAVKFINASYGTMWLKTTGNPGAPDFLPELDTGRPLAPGEEFIYTFLKAGTWGYTNMNHRQHAGAVVVQPQ
jgi:plastocyanin